MVCFGRAKARPKHTISLSSRQFPMNLENPVLRFHKNGHFTHPPQCETWGMKYRSAPGTDYECLIIFPYIPFSLNKKGGAFFSASFGDRFGQPIFSLE
jgi:hypothetical protein